MDVEQHAFAKFQLPPHPSSSFLFDELSQACEFESFPLWRGAILTLNEDGAIPIVRTTTRYTKPSQPFSPAHYDLVERIRSVANKEHLVLNNAMVEIYDPTYKKMKWHSDQALDLACNSYICIYSCYEDENEDPAALRRLVLKRKGSQDETSISMEHDSVIIFSTETNGDYVHKIVGGSKPSKGQWLGVTLRQSKTFITYAADGLPYFTQQRKLGPALTMATEHEQNEFYRHKSQENKVVNYAYPRIDYTLSQV